MSNYTPEDYLRSLQRHFINARRDELRSFAFDDFLQWLRSQIKHGQYSDEQMKILIKVKEQAWEFLNERLEDLTDDA